MDNWFGFYEQLFNFRQIRFFDIEGKYTGLFSRALTSPGGNIRIPINEGRDDKIARSRNICGDYKGEGIQHIAVGTEDLYPATDRAAAERRASSCPARRRPIIEKVDSACRATASRSSD